MSDKKISPETLGCESKKSGISLTNLGGLSFKYRSDAVEKQYQKYESLENQSFLSTLDSLDVQMFRAGRFLVENQITDFHSFTTFKAVTTGNMDMLIRKIEKVEKDIRSGRKYEQHKTYRKSVYAESAQKRKDQDESIRRCCRVLSRPTDASFARESHISNELEVIFTGNELCLCRCCKARKSECDKMCDCCANVKDKIIRLLSLRDGAGASVIHIAYLYKQYDIGRELLNRYPQLSQLKYAMVDGGVDDPRMWPYLGENILHMAVAQRNYSEVKYILSMQWLTKANMNMTEDEDLDLLKRAYLLNLLSAKAYGHFFHPAYKQVGVYFGEYPIQFAVCSNDCDILDLFVMVDPYSLFITDYHGNNVLHLCVLHNLKKMYNYIVKKAEDILRGDYIKNKHRILDKMEQEEREDEDENEDVKTKRKHRALQEKIDGKVKRLLGRALLNVTNKAGYTPFTLAAAEGKSDMFHHILLNRKKMMWEYGPVGCFIVCLTHLDSNGEIYEEYDEDDADIKFMSKLAVHDKPQSEQDDARQKMLDPEASGLHALKSHMGLKPSSGNDTADVSHQCQNDAVSDASASLSMKNVADIADARQTLATCKQRSQSFKYNVADCPELEQVIHGDKGEETRVISAIDLICREGHLEMLDIPEVKQIIAMKWERFGFPTFLWRSFFEICRTLTISLIVCLISYSDGESSLDWFAWSLYPITWMWLLFNFFFDLLEIFKHRWDHYGLRGGIRGAAQLENITRSLVFVFFTITCFCKFTSNVMYSDALTRIFLSLTVLTTWISVYYFLMGFEKSGNFVVIVFNIIGQDLPSFVTSFVIILFGFGSAHAALTSYPTHGGNHAGEGFSIYFHTIWEMFNHAINGQSTNTLDSNVQDLDDWPKKVFTVFAAAFNVCIVIIMLNLLIAMMTERYSQLKSNSHLILARERFNMMIGFERSLTPEMKRKSTQGYAIFYEEGDHKGLKPKIYAPTSCLQGVFSRLGIPMEGSSASGGVKPSCCTPAVERFRDWLVYYGFLENHAARPNFYEIQTIDPLWTHNNTYMCGADRQTISVDNIIRIAKTLESLKSEIDRNPGIVKSVDDVSKHFDLSSINLRGFL